jgi:hypothetical protein
MPLPWREDHMLSSSILPPSWGRHREREGVNKSHPLPTLSGVYTLWGEEIFCSSFHE